MTKGQYYENLTMKNCFDEELTYDKHGNVVELKRNAPVSTGSSSYTTEQLYLRYKGNQLDATGTTAGAFSIFSRNTYNKNGALVSDLKRSISNIRYNTLNLPEQITFSAGHSILYGYDAMGMKRRTEHITVENRTVVGMATAKDALTRETATATDAPVASSPASTSATGASSLSSLLATTIVDQTVTDYCGNIIYENGDLKYILTPEGYVTKSIRGPLYNYYLKDHLGNNRIVMQVIANSYLTIQRTDYYPFGKPYPDGLRPEQQPYKFGGKEYDEMHGLNAYDFEARHLDANIPRFTTMDPLCEKYYSISPYAYCMNNPVKYVDPDGRKVYFAPGVSQEFKNQFATAVQFLNENGAAGMLAKLHASDGVYYIAEINNKASFEHRINTINWDPDLGLLTNEGIVMSPTSVLNHEIDHALQFETNKGKYMRDLNTGTGDDYDNFEEKRVIIGSEQTTARKLGEIRVGEVTRTDHRGTLYETKGVKSAEGKNETIVTPDNNKQNENKWNIDWRIDFNSNNAWSWFPSSQW
jgi:RHS repeat-associated protein